MDQLPKVFIPHEDFVWVAGELISEHKGGILEVRYLEKELYDDNGQAPISKINLSNVTVAGEPLASLPLQNVDVPKDGVDDMCTLSYLHEASILDNLKRRHFGKKPYTFTGDICVAVNPYQWLDLYRLDIRDTYIKKPREKLPPHIYATSAAAFRGIASQINQCILVSGESGAGKTETVKLMMNHLASVASKVGNKTAEKLLKSNHLLESFGNAKTVRNDNSSRFGKFTQLEFDKHNILVGSKCITYLLQKSLVVGQSPGERNYHIMYELLAAPLTVRSNLYLQRFHNPKEFNYTNKGDVKTSTISGLNDSDRFDLTVEALEMLGVPKWGETQTFLFRALASVLHLGQLAFQNVKGTTDAAELYSRGRDSSVDESVDACCELLGVAPPVFSSTISSRTIEVQNKRLTVPLNLEQIVSGRDALAKELYARLFAWLVLVINFNNSYLTNGGSIYSSCSTVSLLDIFGFESFEINRFEQLCINYANEKLQQKFAIDVFKSVQIEYAEEGIRLDSIIFKDNADVLEMIEGRGGIIATLSDECRVPKGNDSNYLSKLSKQLSNHPAFFTILSQRNKFSVRHYAGIVSYTVTNFVETNKDTLANNIIEMLQSSTNQLINRMFNNPTLLQLSDQSPFLAGDKVQNEAFLMLRRGAKPISPVPLHPSLEYEGTGLTKSISTTTYLIGETVTVKFQSQLSALMDKIRTMQVHYVLCLKPNTAKKSTEFNRRLVVEQLRSGGMIAAVKISRQAYPNRLTYRNFFVRYRYLQTINWTNDAYRVYQGLDSVAVTIQITKALLLSILPELKQLMDQKPSHDSELYQFGLTKIYYSSLLLQHMEIMRNKLLAVHVIKLQAASRMYICKKQQRERVRASVLVQKNIRVCLAKRKYKVKLAAHREGLERIAREEAAKARLAKQVEEVRLREEKARKEAASAKLQEDAHKNRIMKEVDETLAANWAIEDEMRRYIEEAKARLRKEAEEERRRLEEEARIERDKLKRQEEARRARLIADAQAEKERLQREADFKRQYLIELAQKEKREMLQREHEEQQKIIQSTQALRNAGKLRSELTSKPLGDVLREINRDVDKRKGLTNEQARKAREDQETTLARRAKLIADAEARREKARRDEEERWLRFRLAKRGSTAVTEKDLAGKSTNSTWVDIPENNDAKKETQSSVLSNPLATVSKLIPNWLK